VICIFFGISLGLLSYTRPTINMESHEISVRPQFTFFDCTLVPTIPWMDNLRSSIWVEMTPLALGEREVNRSRYTAPPFHLTPITRKSVGPIYGEVGNGPKSIPDTSPWHSDIESGISVRRERMQKSKYACRI
jgi:hypothetical protein